MHLWLHFREVSNFDVRFSFLEFELSKLIRYYLLMVFQTSNNQNQPLTLSVRVLPNRSGKKRTAAGIQINLIFNIDIDIAKEDPLYYFFG